MLWTIFSALVSLVGFAVAVAALVLTRRWRHAQAAVLWALAGALAGVNLVVRLAREDWLWAALSVFLVVAMAVVAAVSLKAHRWHQVRPTTYERRAQRGGGHA